MTDKCVKCEKLAKYIWLDEQEHCFKCSQLYSFKDVESIFESMINSNQGPYTWSEWFAITNTVSKVDFGCRFDQGVCTKRTASDPRGCCSGCADCLGYIKSLPPEAIEIAVREFDKHDGFWRQDGCCLPWKFRSPICLSYRCPTVRVGENKHVWIPFYQAVGLGYKNKLSILDMLPRRFV